MNHHQWKISEHLTGSNINFRMQGNVYNHIIITVPNNIDNINIHTGSGNLKALGIITKNAHFKTEDGDLSIKNGQYDSIRMNSEDGNILMKNLQSGISFDAKNEDGDTELNYKEDPHNTRLQTNNEDGDTIITNHALKHKKAGKGQHLVKLSNDSGDIKVK